MTRTEFIEQFVLKCLHKPANESVAELTARLSLWGGDAYDTIHASDAKPESGWVPFEERHPTADDANRDGDILLEPCEAHRAKSHHIVYRYDLAVLSCAKHCPNCRWLGLAEK